MQSRNFYQKDNNINQKSTLSGAHCLRLSLGRNAIILWLSKGAMSGRILSHRLGPLLRRGLLARHVHNVTSRTGGLLRSDGSGAVRGRAWPAGANSIHNNVPSMRAISFARIFPKLALKLARIPAMFGGAMIAGLAYIQYQANRMFNLTALSYPC